MYAWWVSEEKSAPAVMLGPQLGVDVAVGQCGREQQVTVAGEATPQRGAEIGQSAGLPAAQQQLVGPQRPSSDDDGLGVDDALLGAPWILRVASQEAHAIPAAPNRLDQLRRVQRQDLGAVALGERQVRDVHRVLGLGGAAEGAVAGVVARQLRHAAVRIGPRRAGVDGDRYELARPTDALARLEKDRRPRRQLTPGRRLERRGTQHVARKLVVGLKALERHFPGPARILEDARRRADVHVEVVQRPSAHAAALKHVHPRERAVLDQAEAALGDVPEAVPRDLTRRAGKVRGAPAAPAFQNADLLAGLRKPTADDAAAEARPDHHHIRPTSHPRSPTSKPNLALSPLPSSATNASSPPTQRR